MLRDYMYLMQQSVIFKPLELGSLNVSVGLFKAVVESYFNTYDPIFFDIYTTNRIKT